MARKKTRSRRSPAIETPAETLEHIEQLGLGSVRAYRAWCRRHGFPAAVVKSPQQLRKEREHVVRIDAVDALARGRKLGNVKHLVRRLCERGEVPRRKTLLASDLTAAYRKSDAPAALGHLLRRVASTSRLLEDESHRRGVLALGVWHRRWIREPAAWRARTYNADRQFATLARHLTARYDVPAFMDRAWLAGRHKQQRWFLHVAAGGNLRTAPQLPDALTRKMAHHAMRAPADYSFREAFRWGQVHALGGDARLAEAVRGTRLGRDFRDPAFALGVLRFFVAHPLLDRRHLAPIVDYIWDRRFAPRYDFDHRGGLRRLPPAEPRFTMRGRTPETLLRQAERWHGGLGDGPDLELRWASSGIPGFVCQEGLHDRRQPRRAWRIRELTSSAELAAEGRVLEHCVASYAWSCRHGHAAIFTLTSRDVGGLHKHLTVEVRPRIRKICQARGLRNRWATEPEKQVVRRWAARAGLTILPYVW